mmetsp:Transcript_22028/g.33479  ORF Transcript_22028/g.33479 Transcript_22028/m.33479 type:complete len:298 (+) Transcript_22028:75-968(+)
MDELKAKHKKEVRGFESEKRNALRNIKGSAGKGKKGKEVFAIAEDEWVIKFQSLTERHQTELELLANNNKCGVPENREDQGIASSHEPTEEEKVEKAKQKALAKRLHKKQQQTAKEKAREKKIEDEKKNAPNPRQLEIDAITTLYLAKKNLDIEEVAADGNCLYRAVAMQLKLILPETEKTHQNLRSICADEMLSKKVEYEPFADLQEMKVNSFEEYVEKVRNSSEWGGHLELRALAQSLEKTIVVYSIEEPLEIKFQSGDPEKDEDDYDHKIRLSFHRQYYVLGEHYNSVVAKTLS